MTDKLAAGLCSQTPTTYAVVKMYSFERIAPLFVPYLCALPDRIVTYISDLPGISSSYAVLEEHWSFTQAPCRSVQP